MRKRTPSHPLDHHPSFRAVLEAAPPLAELALHDTSEGTSLVGQLVIACSDLADGFAAPPDSRRRVRAHQRAWIAVRSIDREISALGRRRVIPPATVRKAQRAIDRADVLVGALLPM
jgi:hypothetical protein